MADFTPRSPSSTATTDPTAVSRDQRRGHRLWWERLLVPASLVVLATAAVWDMWECLDLAQYGDDARYFANAGSLTRGEIVTDLLSWSPLFVSVNALIILAPLDGSWLAPIHRLDLIALLLRTASAVALWWALRTAVHPLAAAAAAGWWSLGFLGFHGQSVQLFSMLLWTMAAGCFLRRGWAGAMVWATLAVIDRYEGVLWMLAIAFSMVALGHRRNFRIPLRWRAAWLVTSLLLLALCSQTPGRSVRSWLAFGQHYAMALELGEERESGTDAEPMRSWETIVADHFPGAGSIAEALRSNPAALLQHSWANVPRLLPAASDAFLRPLVHRPEWSQALNWLAAILLLTSLGSGAWRRDLGNPLPIEGWILIGTSLALALPQLLLLPRPELFLPAAAPALLLLSGLVTLGLPPADRAPSLATDRVVLAPTAAAILLLALLIPRRCLAPAPTFKRDACRAIQASTGPDESSCLLADPAWSFLALADRPLMTPVELRADQAGQLPGDAILMEQVMQHSDCWILLPDRALDPGDDPVGRRLRSQGWHAATVGGGASLFAPLTRSGTANSTTSLGRKVVP